MVGKSSIARLNHCDVFIDKTFVSRYQADSLIISTPTGSTAYSLAAGGPILMSNVEGLSSPRFPPTPCRTAHSWCATAREIDIVVLTEKEEAYLSVDGQSGMPLSDGDQNLLPQVGVPSKAPAYQGHVLRSAALQTEVGTTLVAEAGASSGLTSKRFDGESRFHSLRRRPQNGPPLILLHGLTRDWTSFSVLFPHLVPRFHVFRTGSARAW